jgi:hypothetical protein
LGTTFLIGAILAISCSLIALIYYSRPKNKVVEMVDIQTKEQILKYHKILSIAPKSVEAG